MKKTETQERWNNRQSKELAKALDYEMCEMCDFNIEDFMTLYFSHL